MLKEGPLKINVPGTEEFSSQATAELVSVLNVYSESIVEECNRLAAVEALDGKPSEVTAAIVRKANTVFQLTNSLSIQKHPALLLRISSVIFPIITGVFPNVVDMKTDMNLFGMFILTIISTGLVVTLIVKDTSK